MKDKDLFARTQYISMYIRVLPVALIIGIISGLTYGWWTFFLTMFASLFFPFPAMYTTGKIADAFVFLYSGGKGINTLQDQLVGEVEKIKLLKRERHFEEALEQAEVVLNREPNHPEALFLKAQILYGFAQYSSANACLNKILAMVPPPDERLVQWAGNLREDALKGIRERAKMHE
jgi:tetratricopeptide (TPR) repeat protein